MSTPNLMVGGVGVSWLMIILINFLLIMGRESVGENGFYKDNK